MIPLNRPFKSALRTELSVGSDFEAWSARHFGGREASVWFASRDGLNAVYRRLREERGLLRVAVSPLTCFIALYPMVANGHMPVFVDVNPDTFNLDERALESVGAVDAVQVIHLGGNPCNMAAISAWAKLNGVLIIEDCAQALGSTFASRQVGAWGDFAVFSLVKNLNAVAGGLLYKKLEVRNQKLEKTKQLSRAVSTYKQLKRWLESRTSSCGVNVWNWLYFTLLYLKERGEGSSFVGSDCKSAPVAEATWLADFRFLDALNERRRAVADAIIEGVGERFAAQRVLPEAVSNRNRLMFRSSGIEAKAIIEALRKKGIAANNLTQSYLHGYQPHISQDSLLGKFYTERLPNYDALQRGMFAVPCAPSLTEREIDYIIRILNNVR